MEAVDILQSGASKTAFSNTIFIAKVNSVSFVFWQTKTERKLDTYV